MFYIVEGYICLEDTKVGFETASMDCTRERA